MLRQGMQCEGLLECFYGLTRLDRDCYQVLIEHDGVMTIDEIAIEVDRERSTAYRSVQRLLRTELVRKKQINQNGGGYYHVYYPAEPDDVTDEMQRLLNEWYARMGQLIQEFEDTYGDRIEQSSRIEE